MVRFSGFSETKTDDCVSLLLAMRPPRHASFPATPSPCYLDDHRAGQFASGFLESHKRLARRMSRSVDEADYKPRFRMGEVLRSRNTAAVR